MATREKKRKGRRSTGTVARPPAPKDEPITGVVPPRVHQPVWARKSSPEPVEAEKRSTTVRVALTPTERDSGVQTACLVIIAGPQLGQVFALKGGDIRLGRAVDADFCIRDPAISRYHAQVHRKPEGAFVIKDLGSTNGTFVDGVRVSEHELRAGDHVQVGQSTILRLDYQAAADREFHSKLFDAGTRDPVTGVYNRRFLEQLLATEFSLARRHDVDVCLLLIDLDGFKGINDTHGHLCGDFVLRHVAEILTKRLRKEDVLARYGGDEFAVLLMHTPEAQGLSVAENLRALVEKSSARYKKTPVKVTLSCGLAALDRHRGYDSPALLIAAADRALYRAKANGRNQVVASSS